MKVILISLLLLSTALAALSPGAWQNLRFSGQDALDRYYIRAEIAPGTTTSNKVLYPGSTAIVEAELDLFDPDNNTYQKQIPGNNARSYLGSRQVSSTGKTTIFPVYYDGSSLPGAAQLTLSSQDEQNTALTNIYDIVADYVSFSDSKLYMAIKNRGGGFPTSGSFGTVYNSYMSIIANPSADPTDPNTIVWAMNYMNVALGGISPGLYKITGTGTSDLIRIGNIESQIISSGNLLIMSCNLSDLLADPDFAAWFNPQNPLIGTQTITNRTTVIPFATTKQDESPGATVNLTKLYYDPLNTAGYSAPELVLEADDYYFRTTYTHSLGYFPMDIYFSLGSLDPFPLFPQSQDYSQPVEYRSENLYGMMPEFFQQEGVTMLSMGGDSYEASVAETYTYIVGLLSPATVEAVTLEGDLLLSWAPVTESPAGTALSVSRYRIEYCDEPGFATPSLLTYSTESGISIPLAGLPLRGFYRIVAEL